MIKLVAVDMDGTLLHDDKTFSEELYPLVRELKEKGCRFVIATGNQYELIKKKFAPIKDDIVYLCENGAKLVMDQKIIYVKTIKQEIAKATLMQISSIEDIVIVMCGTKHAYLRKSDMIHDPMIRLYYDNIEYVDDLTLVDDQIMKFSICNLNGRIQEVANKLIPIIDQSLQLITTGNIWFDIFDQHMNKGNTLKTLADSLQISKDDCAAFGDQMNDLALLQSVEHSYCMINGVDALKKEAKYITELDNNHDGVINEIKKWRFE